MQTTFLKHNFKLNVTKMLLLFQACETLQTAPHRVWLHLLLFQLNNALPLSVTKSLPCHLRITCQAAILLYYSCGRHLKPPTGQCRFWDPCERSNTHCLCPCWHQIPKLLRNEWSSCTLRCGGCYATSFHEVFVCTVTNYFFFFHFQSCGGWQLNRLREARYLSCYWF